MPLALYIASILGAIALVLMMPKRQANWPVAGAVLGAATLGALWIYLSRFLPAQWGIETSAMSFYYIFSALAIISAVRVITHTKPVYAALWFVMVVLASAGLFLTMDAEFVAFAMVIIYGGAILVTYMFVIMLASPSAVDDADEPAPEYDRISREPVLACTAGFLLLALLLNLAFRPIAHQPLAAGLTDQVILHGGKDAHGNYVMPILTHQADPISSDQGVMRQAGIVSVAPGGPMLGAGSGSVGRGQNVTDIEHIGLALFRSHPLGIELAGVILTMSLIGAVVIAKMEVGEEDEVVSPHEKRVLRGQREALRGESV